MKKSWKIYSAIAFVLSVAVLVWWIFRPTQETVYLTEIVRRGDIRQTVQAGGDISAIRLVDVGAQASGQIKYLYVSLGQKVKQGQLIAEIDATSQINELSANRTKLGALQAQLKSKQITLQIAEKNYQREKELWEKDATSRKELESAEESLFSTHAAISEIEAALKQARISLNTSQANLNYTRITSPLDGTVVSAPIRQGQTINSAQSSPMIVQIADLNKMVIRMQIAEGDVTKIKKGMTVEFTTLANPDVVREAVLNSVDPGFTTLSQGGYSEKTDTSSTAIYYFARAIVANPDGMLHIGMSTQNTIIVNEAENVLLLPTSTVHKENKKYYVEVFDKNKQPIKKEIQTGLSDNMNTQIISGLQEGDEVISTQGSAQEMKEQTANTRRRRRM